MKLWAGDQALRKMVGVPQGKPHRPWTVLQADFGLLRQLDKALALEADTKMEGGWFRLIWGFLTTSSCF